MRAASHAAIAGPKILGTAGLLAAVALGCSGPAVSGVHGEPATAHHASLLLSTDIGAAGTARSPLRAAAPVRADTATTANRAHSSAGARWYDDVNTRTAVFLTGAVAGVAAYGAIKWWDRGFSRFDAQPEGWFGRNTDYGGADKLGHAFGTYAGVRTVTHALELLGNSREDAVRMATLASLAVYTGVEVLDGFSKQYKFSKEDAIANLAGGAAGYVLEKYPRLDALIDFRLYYRRSPQAKARGEWEPFGDYNGQKYLLVFKASGVPALDARPVMRYFELALGYGVRGFDSSAAQRSRNLHAGVSLNVARVLDDTVFRNSRQGLLRKHTGLFFELAQPPGTLALARRGL